MGFKIYLAFCWLKNAFSGKNTNFRGFILQGTNPVFSTFLLIEALCVQFSDFFVYLPHLLCKPVNFINSRLRDL